ncbi:N-6 DNA methylase [Bradyrhizobium sp. ISRA463]|uniref:Eco57I restriction-modification methylase domain-containing protein n=1 Tax=Bradyrhizobium sp. ISRA463 TaxID=2866199 RepID=UPI00247A54F5|nr:N-6 DNA methylase [Bradyrhizobium sp. ISRA463]WGS23995.1 N-6 DNA methylase [Bradyrhizobium sp. ISRA463]
MFGFTDIARVGARVLQERQFTISLEALGGRVPVTVVPATDDLDRPSAQLLTDGQRRSASSALQNWLNASDSALWGLCSNGLLLRLVRDNASLTRPAFVEADLRRIFEGDAFADFAALWLLIHASRFGAPGTLPSDCGLERWRDAGQKQGVAARDKLRDGVEDALLSLGTGFLSHPDNGALRGRLQSGDLPLPEFFGELLRLVYRLIFLFAAEDRDLLHQPGTAVGARQLYAKGYSVGALRGRAVKRAAWDRYHDRWEGLLITFAALIRGEKRLGLPALAGLFAHDVIPNLENSRLANRNLMEAIFRLAWLRDESGLMPVNWRDMETEELGSVYESLLELTPQLSDDGWALAFAEGGAAKGHARKTTGSYYTPDNLVQALLDSALDPVLDRVEAETNDSSKALLAVTVLDPACGSGHFLLAAARRIATRLARVRTGGLATPADYRHALRDVARACVYGVDRNPMAVELTKVALWIETVEPGKPLGFLDANIRCGDALIGVFDLTALEKGIPDPAYKPLAGDDRETAKHFEKNNKAERDGQGTLDFAVGSGRLPAATPIAGEAKALRAMPEDSPEEIVAKRKQFDVALSDPRRWRLRVAADLYISAFFKTKIGGVPINRNTATIPTTAHVWEALAGRMPYDPLVGRAQVLAGHAGAFHWPLEFPDIIAAGGFDVVLGNPPWERVKLQEQEFFAARDPEIATAPNASARGRLIEKLKDAAPGTRERALYEEFETAKRTAEASSVFARVPVEDGGRFPLTGRGDVNTYALFTELFANLTSTRGRAGVIVPTGIATDATTAPFFAALVSQERLAQLIDFENRDAIFPAVHRSYKFSLLTIGRHVKQSHFVFFLTEPRQLAERERRFTLSTNDIAHINPNTKTAPIFRSRADAELTAKIYARVPVLSDETKAKDGNPWGMSFHTRIWHMAEDSEWFRTAAQLHKAGFVRDGSHWDPPIGARPRQSALALAGGHDNRSLALKGGSPGRDRERYVPLYEAKMIHQFDHRWATYDAGDSRDTTVAEKTDPDFEPTPRYWVPEREVADRLTHQGWTRGWLMGWRDIARATDERTLISDVIPAFGSGDKFLLMFPVAEPAKCAALLASLNSLACDFVARQKIGATSFKLYLIKQIPILPPSFYTPADLSFITPRVLELTYTSHSMAPFARDLGYDGPPFNWDEDRRARLRAELDAFYARAYGLTRDELRYVLDPTDVKGPDYPSETFRVLKKNETARYGEYRTARLVLQVWDRLERGELTT